MSEERLNLKIQGLREALRERVASITDEYENKIVDLRVELTEQGQQAQEAVNNLQQQVSELQQQNSELQQLLTTPVENSEVVEGTVVENEA